MRPVNHPPYASRIQESGTMGTSDIRVEIDMLTHTHDGTPQD